MCVLTNQLPFSVTQIIFCLRNHFREAHKLLRHSLGCVASEKLKERNKTLTSAVITTPFCLRYDVHSDVLTFRLRKPGLQPSVTPGGTNLLCVTRDKINIR